MEAYCLINKELALLQELENEISKHKNQEYV